MEHDHQWWGNLPGDLGPVCSWQCSKHCLLRLSLPTSPLSIFFLFWTYYLFCQHGCTSYSPLIIMLMPHISMITSPSPCIIMLTLPCYFCLCSQILSSQLWSFYTQPCSFLFHISFYILIVISTIMLTIDILCQPILKGSSSPGQRLGTYRQYAKI